VTVVGWHRHQEEQGCSTQEAHKWVVVGGGEVVGVKVENSMGEDMVQ
jgi:hypothetical protein